MDKTKKWTNGPWGFRVGRAKREASLAGKYNPKCRVVICEGCGTDTTNPDMLCDNCKA